MTEVSCNERDGWCATRNQNTANPFPPERWGGHYPFIPRTRIAVERHKRLARAVGSADIFFAAVWQRGMGIPVSLLALAGFLGKEGDDVLS